MPPVEVAAATWPLLSRATAPTVPNLYSISSALTFLLLNSSSWRRRSGVSN
jgi:hypothetical protein